MMVRIAVEKKARAKRMAAVTCEGGETSTVGTLRMRREM